MKKIQGITRYFEKYRDEEFSTSLQIAKGITTKMSIEPLFFVKSRATRSKQFDESDFQQEILEARKTFKLNSFFFG